MQVLQLVHSQTKKELNANRSGVTHLIERPGSNEPQSVDELPKLISPEIAWEDLRWLAGKGEFF